jgi:hypothetical protein
MKRPHLLLVIGQFTLVISILLNHCVKEGGWNSALVGFFTGTSLVLNFAFIWAIRKVKPSGQPS